MWHTIAVVDAISRREVPSLRAPTVFALWPGEVSFASASVVVESMRAAGDGSYVHSNTVAFGTGGVGLAMLAGSLAGSAIGNANRRAQAAAAAQVTWRHQLTGAITVTNMAFYLQDHTGLFRWDWDSIDLMQVAAFNVVVMQGRSEDGPITWRLTTHWAELVFVLWALNRHPQHPQLANWGWVPANWVEWAANQGHPTPITGQITS